MKGGGWTLKWEENGGRGDRVIGRCAAAGAGAAGDQTMFLVII
jgi:hypothetical protein